MTVVLSHACTKTLRVMLLSLSVLEVPIFLPAKYMHGSRLALMHQPATPCRWDKNNNNNTNSFTVQESYMIIMHRYNYVYRNFRSKNMVARESTAHWLARGNLITTSTA